MAEQEAEHRRITETAIVKAGAAEVVKEYNESRRGQICALIITVTSIAAATYLGMNGHEFAASAIGLGGLGSIVTTFIIGKNSSKPEVSAPQMEQKRPANSGKRKK